MSVGFKMIFATSTSQTTNKMNQIIRDIIDSFKNIVGRGGKCPCPSNLDTLKNEC